MPRDEFLHDRLPALVPRPGRLDRRLHRGRQGAPRAARGARGRRRLDDAPHARRGGAAVLGLPPALRHPAPRRAGRGARRGVQRLVVPPRAEPRPGPDADLPHLRVREDRHAGAVPGPPRRVAASGGWPRSPRSGSRCAPRPPTTRSSAGSARCSRSTSSTASLKYEMCLDLTDVKPTAIGSVELPRGPLRPRLRPAPRRRDAGAQRLHRLRARPDHAGPVRHARHGPRGLARGGAVALAL